MRLHGKHFSEGSRKINQVSPSRLVARPAQHEAAEGVRRAHDATDHRNANVAEGRHGAGIRRGRCKHAQSKRTASAKTIAQPAHRTRKYTTKTHLDTQRRRGKEPYARSRVQLVAWESCGACVDGAWGFSRLRQTVHT